MNNSPADRPSPLGLFPGQPTPRVCYRVQKGFYVERGGELCGLTGPHKIPEANSAMEENSLNCKGLLLRTIRYGFVLCRPGRSSMRFSPNKNYVHEEAIAL
jgi:hypothetical protein